MSLRGRIRRCERGLKTLPPLDPRERLDPDDVRIARELLEDLGAEPPKPVHAEDREWLESEIRPFLPAWLAFERRRAEWRAHQRAREMERRRDVPRWAPSVDSPVFTDAARRAAHALLGWEEEADA
jgi:hypothetical protein